MITQTKKLTWSGYILTVLVALPFIPSGVMKLTKNPQVLEGFAHLGLPDTLITPIAILELVCVAFYLIPKTTVLGAVLLTGYLGGAICTHVRLGEPVVTHVLIGMAIWLGIFLRDARLRDLLPLTKCES